jgi:GT2 family glycosyltransferase
MLDILPDRMFFHTDYQHCFCDMELTDIAVEAGHFVFCDKAVLTHNHPIFTGEKPDGDYERVYSSGYLEHDQRTYWRRKLERYGFKLGIGFPLIDKQVPVDFMISFLTLEKPDYTLLIPKFAVGDFARDIAAVRNNIVEQALDSGCSHLLMLDTDQVYRSVDMIPKMIGHGLPVVGAPVHRRYPPFDRILYRGEIGKYQYVPDEEVYSGNLLEIDATGTGCILFMMHIFNNMAYPWFRVGVDEETGKTIGEDIGFCYKIRQQGISIHCDTSIEIGHMTNFEVTRNTYELFKKLTGFRKNI